jgi:hypothetical protein
MPTHTSKISNVMITFSSKFVCTNHSKFKAFNLFNVNTNMCIPMLTLSRMCLEENERKLKFYFIKFKGSLLCQKLSNHDQIWTWPVHSFDISIYQKGWKGWGITIRDIDSCIVILHFKLTWTKWVAHAWRGGIKICFSACLTQVFIKSTRLYMQTYWQREKEIKKLYKKKKSRKFYVQGG